MTGTMVRSVALALAVFSFRDKDHDMPMRNERVIARAREYAEFIGE